MYIKKFIPVLFFVFSNQAYSVLEFSEVKENKRFLEEHSLSDKENDQPNSPLLRKQKLTHGSEKISKSNQDKPVAFSAELLEFEKQSRHHYAETLFKIGCHYQNGKDVPQDYGKAYSYYVKASNLDYIPAFHNLGCFYSDSDFGVQINYPKAIQYFQHALKNGCKNSASCLGSMFSSGTGCVQNFEDAFEYFKISGENGDAESLYFLGLYSEQGRGVSVNLDHAFYYFSKAAEKGHALALFKAGLYHYQGKSTHKNDVMALDFMWKAQDLGIEEAKSFLKEYTQKAAMPEKKKKVYASKKTAKNILAPKKVKLPKK